MMDDSERMQEEESNGVECEFSQPAFVDEPLPPAKKQKLENGITNGKGYCEQYASHGFCKQGFSCSKSHDLDLILDIEYKKTSSNSSKKKKKKKRILKEDVLSGDVVKENQPLLFEQTHSASFDAYMTGYIYASQAYFEEDMTQHKNRLYLIGKDRPLLIEKSRFGKMSAQHQQQRLLL